MGIFDKEKRTFTDPDELHNEEAMEGMFNGTGLTALYLDQEPQAVLKKKWEILMRQIFRKLAHGHRLNMLKW